MADGYYDHAKGRVVWGRLEPSLESNIAQRDALETKIENQLREVGMLKGTGFVVIDPQSPTFAGDEIENLEDAQNAATNVAYTTKAGYAIVYAPIAVIRPKREAAIATPSKLMQQVQQSKLLGQVEAPKS